MTPFVGSAGNALNRVILSSIGTLIWGITSVGIGAAQSFAQVSIEGLKRQTAKLL